MSVAGAADALADRGEDIEEHEHEQEGLYDSAQAEDDDVLAQHHEVAPHKCPQRAPAGGDGRPDRAETDLLAVGVVSASAISWAVDARAAPSSGDFAVIAISLAARCR